MSAPTQIKYRGQIYKRADDDTVYCEKCGRPLSDAEAEEAVDVNHEMWCKQCAAKAGKHAAITPTTAAPPQIKYRGQRYKRADRSSVYLALYRVSGGRSRAVQIEGKKYPAGTLILVKSLGLAHTDTDTIQVYKPGPEITVQHKELENVIEDMRRLDYVSNP